MEKIVLFALTSLIVIITVKKYSPDYSVLVTLLSGIGVLLLSMDYVIPVLSLIGEYSREANISSYMMSLLVKAIACAYLAQFAIDICKDAGENSLASKIETSAKIIIGSMSLPAMVNLIEYLREMLVKI